MAGEVTAGRSLKALDTFCSKTSILTWCIPTYAQHNKQQVHIYQYKPQGSYLTTIHILLQFEHFWLNWSSKLLENNERKYTLVALPWCAFRCIKGLRLYIII